MHKVLDRQLQRLGLSEESVPATVQQWADFLHKVNNCYEETDKERYLLDRSIEISSRELVEVNQLLENAQHIAQLGHWLLGEPNQPVIMSKELRLVLGIKAGESSPTLRELVSKIHTDDRQRIKTLLNCVMKDGAKFEDQFRILHPDGQYHWLFMAGQPYQDKKTLVSKYSGIVMDITDRKRAEEEVASLNEKLIVAAREAGKADVSTSILHNVGNVLNSVSVSLDMLGEAFTKARLNKFEEICELLKANIDQIDHYLTQDPKGKLIPSYLIALSSNIKNESATCQEEIKNLKNYIQHIKDIVASQNSFSTTSCLLESVQLKSIVESSLKMAGEFNDNEINPTVKTIYDFNESIRIDKSKFMQILVNLIQNAKEAISSAEGSREKSISIRVINDDDGQNFKVVVKDSGMGIDPLNLTKIFSFGFSTKDYGHGFGLHASALAAKEMGGSLIAESEGVGKGATFTLTLPIHLQRNKQ